MRFKSKLTVGFGVLGISFLLLATLFVREGGQQRKDHATSSGQSRHKELSAAIACRGRIEPEDGIIRISVPSSSSLGPALVAELKFDEGDDIREGNVLALLDSWKRLEAAWHVAQTRIQVSRSRLEQVKAGAKSGDLAAQEAEILKLRREVVFAEAECRRCEKLRGTGAVSVSMADLKRVEWEARVQQLRQAEEKLKSLAEIRETDILHAENEVAAAVAEAERAKAEFDQARILSPITGKVIKIHARPGERVGDEGVAELAKTGQMYAVAEVYETDIGRVRQGQKALVFCDALESSLEGVVHKVGMKVDRSGSLDLDPASFSDERIVEVKIRLLESQKVAGLINAQAIIRIQP